MLLHPLIWPLVFLLFFLLLLVRAHSHHDTQDVIMHESPLLVAIPLYPTLGVFSVVLFLLCLLVFVVGFVFSCFCLFALWFVLCFSFLAGTAY